MGNCSFAEAKELGTFGTKVQQFRIKDKMGDLAETKVQQFWIKLKMRPCVWLDNPEYRKCLNIGDNAIVAFKDKVQLFLYKNR